jgi:hypothetical protein
MDLQQPQHAGFVATHLAAETHDVGEHDRGQPPRLCGLRAHAVLGHGGDYRARGLQLSNRTGPAFFLALQHTKE